MPASCSDRHHDPCRTGHVIDTNVLLLAHYPPPQEWWHCSLTCIEWLEKMREKLEKDPKECLLLDTTYLILKEYNHHFQSAHRRSGAGVPVQSVAFQFIKWIYQHQGNDQVIAKVPIVVNEAGGTPIAIVPFDMPPGFDNSDRKFLAVALAWPHLAMIHNATDTDWNLVEAWIAQTEGIELHQLCPESVNPPSAPPP